MLGLESFFSTMSSGDSEFSAVMFKLLTFAIGGVGFALCFFGYKLQRFYIALMFGLTLGAVCVGVGVAITENTGSAVILLGLLGLIVGLIVGYKFFKAVTALTFALVGFGISYALCVVIDGSTEELSVTGLLVGLLIAAGLGFLVHKFYRPVVIITTAIQGATMCVNGFAAMLTYDGFVDYSMSLMRNVVYSGAQMFMGQESGSGSDGTGKMLVILLLLGLGVFFQWKTAGNKISNFFHSFGQKKVLDGEKENATNAATSNWSNRAPAWLTQPMTLPDAKYLNLCLMLGAVCGLFSLLRGGNVVTLVATLALVAAIVLLLLQKRGMAIANIAVNGFFLLATAMQTLVLLQSIIYNTGLFTLLTPAAAGVFLGAFWFSTTKKAQGNIPFLVSAGLAAVQLIFYMVNGSFNFFGMAILILNLPLILPTVQQYTSTLPQQVARLNNSLSTPQTTPKTEEVITKPKSSQEATAPSVPVSAPPQSKSSFCAQCGHKLVDGSAFCSACGPKTLV